MNNTTKPKVINLQPIVAGRVPDFMNLFTLGYLDCINIGDGTKKADISDELYYSIISNMPGIIEMIDRFVYGLTPIRLSKLDEAVFATINSIYGHYTTKGFDKNDKFAIVLKEDLRERGMILVKSGITPVSAMIAEFLKEISA